MIFRLLRSGRRTCFRIIRVLGQSAKNTFRRGRVFWHSLKEINAAFSAKSSVGTAVVFWRIWWAPFSQQLLRGLKLVKGLVVFARKLWLGATTIPPSISLGNCWMGCLNLAGWWDRRWNLRRPNSTRLCVSSDRWRRAATDPVLQSTACLPSAINPVSVLGGICIRLVFLCPKILWKFHDLTICCFRSFNW